MSIRLMQQQKNLPVSGTEEHPVAPVIFVKRGELGEAAGDFTVIGNGETLGIP